MTEPLSPEDRQRVETLFARAAELPPTEHSDFVERECGPKGALRDELSRLLSGLAGEDVVSRLKPGTPLQRGTRVGAYKLLERIGEGGMGEVYAADQLEPVVRRVALKVIKLGMDSAQVVARFEAERQALARMAHPSIAQVYDAGMTDDGRPYFVMEFVEGVPITDYCDRHKLSTRQRLELFLGICAGVQHAHQKGIIHRDLKPSNLLVMEQDGRAVAKIIDFGVARATTGRLAELTLHTMVGQIVGTLDYMSPEQADPSNTDIDTRSDVYSLGVVLYQLVSGLLPFEQSSTSDLPLSEVLRAIREQDPPSPSTRLRRHMGAATTLAPHHGTDKRSLIRQLAGDLDWICLKALEKDPARRYQSASELAADLRRHLALEPVLASRPGGLYRARKFVRRHRVGVAAALLVTAGIVAGLFGTFSAVAAAQRTLAQKPYADAHLLRKLKLRADNDLWPPHPNKIHDLHEWLLDARYLADTLPGHRASLMEMRQRALPRTPEEQRRDREDHLKTLADKRGRLKSMTDHLARLKSQDLEATDARIPALQQEVTTLEAEVDARRTWSFEIVEDQSRHDSLTKLVEGLETFCDDATGLLGSADAVSPEHGWSIPRRLAFARKLEAGFAKGGAYAAAWEDLAADPDFEKAYPGLKLHPQMGLVPIGQDPGSKLWEFAHLMTGDPPQRNAQDRLELTEKTGVVLVLIQSGSFAMGQGGGVHEVQLSPYFLSKYEMTQGQWKRLTGRNPSRYGPDGTWQRRWLESGDPPSLLHPVEQVSWQDCCEWLPRAGLVLPSEAQWENGARGGTQTAWWPGSKLSDLQDTVNLSDSYAKKHGGEEHAPPAKLEDQSPFTDGSTMHAAVGTYPANGFGLYEVCGNVFEWCLDGYDREFYRRQAEPDPVAPCFGDEPRVYRGGSYRGRPEGARSAARSYYPPSMAGHALGVRPAARVMTK